MLRSCSWILNCTRQCSAGNSSYPGTGKRIDSTGNWRVVRVLASQLSSSTFYHFESHPELWSRKRKNWGYVECVTWKEHGVVKRQLFSF